MLVTVQVEVEAKDVIDQLDVEELAALGLIDESELESDPVDWQTIADSIRRADFRKAEELITEAARSAGVEIPPFAVARVA